MMKQSQITLRAVEPLDADFMYEVENDTLCWRYGETIAPLSRRILRDYALTYDANPFSARQLRLIVSDFSSNASTPTGILDLYEIDPVNRRAYVGIYILPQFRGRGIATAALQLLQAYAKHTLQLRILAANIESVNLTSIHLFEKAGFIHQATIPEWFILADGGFSNLLIFTKRV